MSQSPSQQGPKSKPYCGQQAMKKTIISQVLSILAHCITWQTETEKTQPVIAETAKNSIIKWLSHLDVVQVSWKRQSERLAISGRLQDVVMLAQKPIQ